MGKRRTAAVAFVLALAGAVPISRGEDSPGPWLEAPLRFHVAEREGARVAEPAFVSTQLEAATRIFAPHRVRFRRAETVMLPARHAVLVSRQDRDDLAEYVQPGAVDVFVIATLMDVDEPGRKRCGVHWRPRHAPDKHLVIVRAGCMDDVLAHELGHFFGLRRHSDVPGNLMSYERGDAPVAVLEARQVERVRDVLTDMLRGELRRAEPAAKP